MRRTGRFRRLALILSIGMLAGTTLLANAPARATFPGVDGRIAFWDFNTRQIYTVNPDGTRLVQLTDVPDGATAAHPSWSPDGTRIAFDSDVTGEPRLWIMDADGGNPHRLVGDRSGYADFAPKFTPNGRRIVFSRCRPDPPGGCALYSVRTDGAGRYALTLFNSDVADFKAEVSPDGTRITFTRFGANGILAQVYVMRADGSDAHAITASRLEGFSPNWSPDGQQITFSSACCRLQSNIYTMHPDGTGLGRLTATPFPNNSFHSAYAPEGDRIVFASDRRYDDLCCVDLFLMGATGTKETLIDTGLTGVLDPVWGSAAVLATHSTDTVSAQPLTGLSSPSSSMVWCRSLPALVRTFQHC